MFTGAILKEAINIAFEHGLLECLQNTSKLTQTTATILRSNPKLVAEATMGLNGQASQAQTN